MISNGNFYIPKLKNVVFFGSLIKEKEFIQINKKLSLSTEIITSPDQSTNIDKNIKFKVIKNIDKKIKNYLKKNIILRRRFLYLWRQDGFSQKRQLNFSK